MRSKPCLLVDVDGVISLFGFDLSRPPAGRWIMVDGIAHLISERAGGHLRSLAERFELVWCTGWEEKANDHLVAPLGLDGPLPTLSFDRNPGRGNTHWKLAAIDAFVGPERPLAWLDDAHDARCRDWATNRTGRTLLVRTEPAVGLCANDVRMLLAWADASFAAHAGGS